MSEQSSQPLTAKDIRFTTKAGALYAVALGWPKNGVVRIHTLAEDSAAATGSIERVEAVGAGDGLPFKRSRAGLEVRLPEGRAGSVAVALKLRGQGLV
jgi:alpha-L-fucosidase